MPAVTDILTDGHVAVAKTPLTTFARVKMHNIKTTQMKLYIV